MRFMKIFAALTAMIALLASCTQTGGIKNIFGVDVSGAEIITDTDSHGWFGDGERFIELRITDESTKKKISETWNDLSGNDWIAAIIWGVDYEKDGEDYHVGPFVLSEIPSVAHGRYCFENRGDGEIGGNAEDLVSSPPRNFTAAIYDEDKGTVYYVEMDS